MFFGCNASGINLLNAVPLNGLLKCISMNNQKYKIKPKIINISSNEPLFYLYSIKVNKCSGSCNDIDDPFSKSCILDVVKNMNVKVFNPISRTNETRHIKWHETCNVNVD